MRSRSTNGRWRSRHIGATPRKRPTSSRPHWPARSFDDGGSGRTRLVCLRSRSRWRRRLFNRRIAAGLRLAQSLAVLSEATLARRPNDAHRRGPQLQPFLHPRNRPLNRACRRSPMERSLKETQKFVGPFPFLLRHSLFGAHCVFFGEYDNVGSTKPPPQGAHDNGPLLFLSPVAHVINNRKGNVIVP